MKKLMLAVLFVLIPVLTSAQATGSSKLTFDQQAATLAEANSLTYRYYPDAATTGITVAVACTGTVSPFVCQTPFPAFTPGNHSLTVTAANAAGETAKSAPLNFTFVVVPSIPQNLRIQ
jgi:hypothetical protein